MHNQLIRYPDIAFFVAPIPLHIAAMVILYGHMSRCDVIPKQTALEDVWMALDMLPSFRWRWEGKDLSGGHPLIAKLAEKVLDANLHQVAPTGAPMLLSEQDWDSEGSMKPQGGQQPGQAPATPKMGPAQYGGMGHTSPYVQHGVPPGPGPAVKGSPGGGPGGGGAGGGGEMNGHQKMPEVPPFYFYPLYNGQDGTANGGVQVGPYGYQSAQDQYVLEEKESISPTVATAQMQWTANGVSARARAGLCTCGRC